MVRTIKVWLERRKMKPAGRAAMRLLDAVHGRRVFKHEMDTKFLNLKFTRENAKPYKYQGEY